MNTTGVCLSVCSSHWEIGRNVVECCAGRPIDCPAAVHCSTGLGWAGQNCVMHCMPYQASLKWSRSFALPIVYMLSYIYWIHLEISETKCDEFLFYLEVHIPLNSMMILRCKSMRNLWLCPVKWALGCPSRVPYSRWRVWPGKSPVSLPLTSRLLKMLQRCISRYRFQTHLTTHNRRHTVFVLDRTLKCSQNWFLMLVSEWSRVIAWWAGSLQKRRLSPWKEEAQYVRG